MASYHHPDASLSDMGLSASLKKHSQPSLWRRFKDLALNLWSISWWTLEYLALCISLLSAGGLIAVLHIIDGSAQQQIKIGRLDVTFNAIIATISTIIRASLMAIVANALNQSSWNWFSNSRHDLPNSGKPLRDLDVFGQASSDAWSSLKLLWRTKGRNLATLGAIITVLSLAFDTFSQVILTLETRSVIFSDGVSTGTPLGRATSFTGQSRTSGVNPDVTKALISSIIDPNLSLPQSPCSTGNCTWPTTPTLGVCSSCLDVRSEVIESSGPAYANYSLLWTKTTSTSLYNEEALALPTPQLLSLGYGNPPDGDTGNDALITHFVLLGISPSGVNNTLEAFNTTLGAKLPVAVSMLDPLVRAYNCSFRFCLQATEVETVNGKQRSWQSGVWTKAQFYQNNSIGLDPRWSNGWWQFFDVPPSMNVANLSEYWVDAGSVRSLRGVFQPLLDGNASYATYNGYLRGGDDSFSDYGYPVIKDAFWQASESLESITSLCQQIADGFTTWMRTANSAFDIDEDGRYSPTTFIDRVFFRVRWLWLIFPLGMLLASHIFLLATMSQTSGRQAKPWKDHRIPLLLADVDWKIKEIAAHAAVGTTGKNWDLKDWSRNGKIWRRRKAEDIVGDIKVRMDYDEAADRIIFLKVG